MPYPQFGGVACSPDGRMPPPASFEMGCNLVRALLREIVAAGQPAGQQRAAYDQIGDLIPWPASAERADTFLGGVPARLIDATGRWSDTTILYLHGGWYAAGSFRSHEGFAAELSRRTGSRVALAGYRLAPADPFPAAVQ